MYKGVGVGQVFENAEYRLPDGTLSACLIFAMGVSGLYASSLYSYTLFHSLVEVFCVLVVLTIFVISWNARKLLDNHYILFLGISFLSSAAFELVHMLAYKGVGVFPENNANLPTQLYIASRYVFSIALLIAPIFITRLLNAVATLIFFAVITALLFVAIFAGFFPDCFIEGQGLTSFKIWSEYIIIVLMLTALWLLIKKRSHFDPRVLRMLVFSIICAAFADASFTQYLTVFGTFNFVGHLFLLISAILSYSAILVTGIERPMAIIFRNLEKSEERLRLIAETSVDLIFQLDLSGKVVFCSPSVTQYGYSIAETIGNNFNSFIFKDDLLPAASAFERAIGGEPIQALGLRLFSKDGAVRHAEINIAPIKTNGAVVGLQGISRDVTSRRQAEEQINASLAEKEVMLREIHHRVKNNLQVISSLVSLQVDSLPDERIREELTEVRDRIRSMALVHEKLYQTRNMDQLDFAEYAKSLLHYLWRSHGTLAERVRLELALASIVLPIEAAVPCGLALNELVVNALRHAFPGEMSGKITVELACDEARGVINLRVNDNGIGLPQGFDWRQSRSLGLRLVKILAGQLRGTMEVASDGGTDFRVTFPMQ